MQTQPDRSQAPGNTPRFCVLYLKQGQEKRSPWMTQKRANEAAALMRAKYGERNAIVYRD